MNRRVAIHSAIVSLICLLVAAALLVASVAWPAMLSGYTVAPGTGGGGGTASNSFTLMDAPTGTDPSATTSTDTLTFTAGTNFVITGNSSTNTLDFSLGNPTDCGAGEFVSGIGGGLVLSCAQPGNVTGNAATATALAADPTDCTLPNVALGINASGTAQCFQPSNVTGNAATATALAANGGNCTSGEYAVGVNASGVAECSTTTLSVGVTGNAGTATALAADPTDCTLPNVALGINASGIAQCSQPSNVTGNAATATALAGNPSDCGANAYATTIDASGNLTCAQPSFSNLSGTLALSQLTDDATASKCLLSGGSSGDPAWSTCPSGGGGSSSNSFETMNAPSGTDPVASSATDTLNFAATAPVTITGDSSTDTLTFALADITPDCSAKQFVNAVGANGALTCAQPSDVTGNAATATALAANGGNCTTGQYSVGVDASGVAECSTASLSANASTATALASNPSDCGANTYATTIDASGNLTCSSVSLTAGVTGTLPAANGGTNSTLVAFTGPTVARTFTLPDATTTLCGINSVCTGYQAGPLTGGDVTTSGTTATIGNDKILEPMLKVISGDTPADEECLTYEATGGDFEWQTCGSGSGITGITGGSGGTTTGSTVTLAGGDGTTTTRSSDTITIATASDETNFLANAASLTCSSSTGKLIVDTTGPTLSFCNGSTAYNAALGNDSDGSAKALNTGAGTDDSRGITLTDNTNGPGVGSSGQTIIHSKAGIGYVLPYHAAATPGYQIQASQVRVGSTSAQSAYSSTTLKDMENVSSFTIKANKTYWLQGSVRIIASASSADPTLGIKLGGAGTTMTTVVRVTCNSEGNNAVGGFTIDGALVNSASGSCTIGGAYTMLLLVDGYVTSTADGTFTIQYAAAGTGSVTLEKLPMFRLTEYS